MKKLLLFALLLALFAGCKRLAVSTVQQGDFQVQLLFENDGCKVYRFKDGTSWIYYSDCRGKISHTETRSTGKGTYTVNQETLNNEY